MPLTQIYSKGHTNTRCGVYYMWETWNMFYFTAQCEPNWGVEDGNVKRLLQIFKMSPLPNVMGNVAMDPRPRRGMHHMGRSYDSSWFGHIAPRRSGEEEQTLLPLWERPCGLRAKAPVCPVRSTLCGEAYISQARRFHGALRQSVVAAHTSSRDTCDTVVVDTSSCDVPEEPLSDRYVDIYILYLRERAHLSHTFELITSCQNHRT